MPSLRGLSPARWSICEKEGNIILLSDAQWPEEWVSAGSSLPLLAKPKVTSRDSISTANMMMPNHGVGIKSSLSSAATAVNIVTSNDKFNVPLPQ